MNQPITPNLLKRLRPSLAWLALIGLCLAVASAVPAAAEIDSLSPDSATVVQGGVATASLSVGPAGGCVTASSPEITIVVTVLPGCLLADHLVAIVTTVLTPPGVYTISFEERPLIGGVLLGSAQLTLTVNPLIEPEPPITTTTTTTTPETEPGQPSTTTTRPHVEVTATTSTTAATTTTTPTAADPPLAPPTTTPGIAPPFTTTTTKVSTSDDPPNRPDMPGATNSTTTTVAETGEGDDETEEIGAASHDGSDLPPPPESVVAAGEPERIRTFLHPFLPDVVADTIASPIYVLGSILEAVFATGTRVAVGGLVALAYGAYLMRRWWTPKAQNDDGQPA